MRRTLYNWHDHLASRREFLTAALLGTAAAHHALGGVAILEAQSADLCDTADAILERIAAPRFPQRTFDIRNYGATTTTDATAAFRAAIEAGARGGGGRVLVPKGRFESGASHLRSNVNLHLDDGAT